MKRSLFFIAAAALAFAACSDNDAFRKDINESSSENGGVIGFTSFTEKVTKAENSDALYSWTFYDHQESFQVWARKNNQPLNDVFKGTTVTVERTGAGTDADPYVYTYKYSPDRYWDKLADNYNFYAAAPAPAQGAAWSWKFNEGGITDGTTIDKGYFTTQGTFALNGVNLQSNENNGPTNALKNVFKTATNNSVTDIDLLIADETPVTNAYYNKANPDAVNLNFIHILSKLNITISTSLPTTGTNAHDVDLLAFEVKNVPNTGSFDEHSKDFATSKKQIRWTLDATPTKIAIPTGIEAYNATTYAIDESEKIDVPYTNAAAPAPAKKYIVESLFIPQAINYQRVALDGLTHDLVNEAAVPYSSYEAYERAKHNDVDRLTQAQFDALFATKYTTFVDKYENYTQVSENIDQNTFNERKAEATNDNGTPDDDTDDAPYADYATYKAAKGDNPALSEKQFAALFNQGAFVAWDAYTQVPIEDIDETEFKRRIDEASATPKNYVLAYTELTEPYFTITYSIDGEVFTANYNLAAAFLGKTNNETVVENETVKPWTGSFDFYEGWQNTLNIIINPTAIQFTADVAEWSTNTEVSYEVK